MTVLVYIHESMPEYWLSTYMPWYFGVTFLVSSSYRFWTLCVLSILPNSTKTFCVRSLCPQPVSAACATQTGLVTFDLLPRDLQTRRLTSSIFYLDKLSTDLYPYKFLSTTLILSAKPKSLLVVLQRQPSKDELAASSPPRHYAGNTNLIKNYSKGQDLTFDLDWPFTRK